MIAVASIVFGYAFLVYTAGPIGLCAAAVHVGIMCAGTWRPK